MSEETMTSIISYIDQYYCDKHTTPSAGEISMGVGIPRTTAYRYLVEMDNRGMIEYDGKSCTIRTPDICHGRNEDFRFFFCRNKG